MKATDPGVPLDLLGTDPQTLLPVGKGADS